MQISALKDLGLFRQKNNNNLNPFENSKEYKFWDFTWIEIILPRSYENIDRLISSNFGMQIPRSNFGMQISAFGII